MLPISVTRLDLYRIILRVRYTNKDLVLYLCMYVYISVCMWVCMCECEYVCMYEGCDTILHRIFWHFDILTFEILTRGTVFLEESEVVGGLLRYLKKMRTCSPLLSSGHFFATRPLYSLFCTSASKSRQPVEALNENSILVSKIAPTHTRTHPTKQEMINYDAKEKW